MTAVATTPVSAEEFYDWANLPENRGRRFELEKGEIVEMSGPELAASYQKILQYLAGFRITLKNIPFECSPEGVIIRPRAVPNHPLKRQ